ncbi:MAG: DNA replication and repair protein RecF [Patescibacteria group bacterium]|nr:DNA replication and repair protein RecF [Patescibacteria group bacterium]
MFLKHLSFQNFRSYTKSEFTFNNNTTFIVGPNTAGKSNLIEAIYLLSTGKSFRAEKDLELIKFGESISRIKGKILNQVQNDNEESTDLEVLLVNQDNNFSKKYRVNGIGRRQVDFSSNLTTVLFHPENLDIIIGSPSLRRSFLNNVLEQTDREYRVAMTAFEKSLRQRNALLDLARETGKRNNQQFEYWDEILIKNGEIITRKREELIEFLNSEKKDIFDFNIVYDKSVISETRLLQYKDAEMGAGVTLVGPHRDDIEFSCEAGSRSAGQISNKNIKLFGSRGQQRLAILQLKLLELDYIEKKLGERPVFLLDDIFSELDENHIKHILKMTDRQQTIITTTHKEFVPKHILDKASIIEPKKPEYEYI